MRRAVLLTVLLFLLVIAWPAHCAVSLQPLYATGSPDCPCIDPWATDDPSTAFAVHGNQTCLVTDWGQCYPTTYGSGGCTAHDASLPATAFSSGINTQCENNTRPLEAFEWCRTPWCWVDPKTCHRPHYVTSYFANRTDRPSYSYQTCGYLNTYVPDHRVADLAGKTLRVTFPSDDDSGYTLLTTASGTKDGSYVSFMRELARVYSFAWVVQPLSASSKAKFPQSSFTACVHDVGINHTDLCIANHWVSSAGHRHCNLVSTEPLTD
jgi:hypothetical protein